MGQDVSKETHHEVLNEKQNITTTNKNQNDVNGIDINQTVETFTVGRTIEPEVQIAELIVNSENIQKRPVLSEKAKKMLVDELLKAEVSNSNSNTHTCTNVPNYLKAPLKSVVKSVINVQKQNINELELENKMLRESVEKYRKLYYDLLEIVPESYLTGTSSEELIVDGVDQNNHTENIVNEQT